MAFNIVYVSLNQYFLKSKQLYDRSSRKRVWDFPVRQDGTPPMLHSLSFSRYNCHTSQGHCRPDRANYIPSFPRSSLLPQAPYWFNKSTLQTRKDSCLSYIIIFSISISILTLGSKYIVETQRKLYLVFNNTASTYLEN